jgi:hypothetical protein
MGESFSVIASRVSRRDLETAIFKACPTLVKKGETLPGLTPGQFEELRETIALECSAAHMSGGVDARTLFGIYQDGDWAVYFNDGAGLLDDDSTSLEALSRIVGPLVCVQTETHGGYALFDSWPAWKRSAPARTLADKRELEKFMRDTATLGSERFAAYQDGPWSVQWAGGHYGDIDNLRALSRRVGALVCIAIGTRSANSASYQYFDGGELRREVARIVREVVEKGAPRAEEAGVSLTTFAPGNAGFAWPIWMAHGLSNPHEAKNLRGYVFDEGHGARPPAG